MVADVIVDRVVALEETDHLPTESTIEDREWDVVGRHDLVSHHQSPLADVVLGIGSQDAVADCNHPGGRCRAAGGQSLSIPAVRIKGLA